VIQMVIALVLFAAGFGGGWAVNGWRINSNAQEQELVQVRFSAAADVRRLDNALAAQDKATARTAALRRDADALRGSVNSLSSFTAETMRAAHTSFAACTVRVDTLGELLDASTEAYRDLAGEADRHTSDIQTLRDAWPK
jgi:hypothetical protein